jgi:CheY-like chemotaxis protein
MKTNNNRILLIDDEPDIMSLFSTALEDYGFIVDSFNDPLLPLETFKQKYKEQKNSSYALAVLDINELDKSAAILSTRGKVLENGITRYCKYMSTSITSATSDKKLKTINLATEELTGKVSFIISSSMLIFLFSTLILFCLVPLVYIHGTCLI